MRAVTFAFALLIGSFLNVVIFRLPLMMQREWRQQCDELMSEPAPDLPEGRFDLVAPRSRCRSCGAEIKAWQNIPVLSYLMLGARCRHCNAAISARYPAVEALTGVLAVLLALQYGFSVQWFLYLAFCSAIIVLVVIDLDHRILPDVITLNGIWIGVVASLYLALPSPFALRVYRLFSVEVTGDRVVALTASLLGLAFGGGLLWFVREAFFRIRGIEGMGFGDVKMMAMVGAFLGLPLTLLTILLGSVVGSVTGLAVIGLFGKSRNYELPFGTFLGMGAVIAVMYGNDLIRLYLEYAFPSPA